MGSDDDDEVVLLSSYVNVFTTRARMALSLKGVHYESKEEDMENQSPSSLLQEMNPVHKKIPVLIHNGKPICESLIILQYIDEVWNHKSPLLLPSDPYNRAQARFWADFIDKKIYECLKAWVFKTRDENAIKEEQIDNLKVLERELGEKLYFGGESIGFLDLVLVTYYTWFVAFEKEVKLSIEAECPKLIEWVKRCLQNESISNSLVDPLKLYDFVLHKRKIAGVH